ncbi:hypothetical protein D9M68_800920 [compost metagenome]
MVIGPPLVPVSADRRELASAAREVVQHLAQGAGDEAVATVQRMNHPAQPAAEPAPASAVIS